MTSVADSTSAPRKWLAVCAAALVIALVWALVIGAVSRDTPWPLTVGIVLTAALLWGAAAYLTAVRRIEKVEAAERRNARTLADVIDTSNDVYVEFDAAMRIVEMSRRIEVLVGVKREDFIGLGVEDLRGEPAETEGRAVFWQAVAERKPFRNIFAPIMLPNGGRYWVKGSGLPMLGETGEFSGYRCMIFGLPEIEVRGSSQVHQDRMSALGQLAGGIAHDFNNLLAAILGFASLLEQDLKDDAPKLKLVQRVLTSTNRAKDLVQRILSFARVNPGATEDVDVGAAIQEMTPLIRSSLPASTRLDVSDRTSGEIVSIDRTQLGQLVVNLCTNANDALEGRDGVISLAIGPSDEDHPSFQLLLASKVTSSERYTVMRNFEQGGRILIGHVEPGARYIRLSMQDTGGGIEPKELGRIFEPYFTTRPNRKGGGLGLSVVHGVMLAAKGALAVTTRHGEGTTVDLFLPVARLPAGDAVAVGDADEAVGTVLVVDDESEVREMVALALERSGMTVLQCVDGAEALTTFEADPSLWDVVVTDHGMPNMRGDELIRRIKAIAPEVPCVLCTGFSETMTEEYAHKAGADAFLLKPMTPDLLQRTVAQLISIRRAGESP